MAAYARANAAAAAGVTAPGAMLTVQAERDLQEQVHRLMRPALPPMTTISDRWISVRGRRVFCRLYRPNALPRLPVVVYFHGGGWCLSSVDTHENVAMRYAADGQVAVLSVDYALSPEAKFPYALEECAAVTRYVCDHAAEFDIDPAKMMLAGDSAGGALAFGTALLLRDAGGPAPRGILAAYPVCDGTFESESYREFGNTLNLTTDKMKFFWASYVREPIDMLHPLASPLRANLQDMPPTLVHAAEFDVLRSEAIAMAERLRSFGVDVECETFPGLTHGFMRAAASVTKAREAATKAGGWMRRILG